MNVLLASDFYRPFIGGAERQVQLLASALADRGHGVSVATVWHDGLAECEQEKAVTVTRLSGFLMQRPWFSRDPRRRFHPPFPEPGITRGLRRLIAETRPAVVHANGWIAYSCAAAVLGTSIPLVISVRDYGYSCAVRNLMRFDERICSGPGPAKCAACSSDRYGRPKGLVAVAGVFAGRPLLKRRVGAIHSVSGYVEGIVQRDLMGSTRRKGGPRLVRIADIAPPATNHTLIDPAGEGGGEELPEEPFILFVGQLQAHKGIHVLLEAYSRLSAPPPLVLIGTVWPDTPRVLPAGVTVIRDAPHATVLTAWRRSLFGIVPSVWPDPLPGVVREGMSRGKAVIGSAVGGIVDMIEDDRTGLLVPPGDADSLREAMARLIADAGLRQRLGDAARVSASPYTADAIAMRFEEVYSTLIDGQDAARS